MEPPVLVSSLAALAATLSSAVVLLVFKLRRTYRTQLHLTALATNLAAADWEAGLNRMVDGLTELGYAKRAVVVHLGPEGPHLVAASAPVSPDPALRERILAEVLAAIEGGEVVLDRPNRRILIPIFDGQTAVAALVLHGVPRRLFRGHRLEMLRGLAAVAGAALDNTRRYKRATLLSVTDDLTGLYNHRHFQQTLGAALGDAYLHGSPLCLALLDIDYFKRVNDTYGHLYGDQVLRALATAVKKILPPGASLARYGGEEFAVIFRHTDLEHAVAVCEEIRRTVEAVPVPEPSSGRPLTVTASIGLAGYQLGLGKSRLVAAADLALYRAKAGGRNRIEVADPADQEVAASVSGLPGIR